MIASRLIPLCMIIGAIGLFIGYTQPTYDTATIPTQASITDVDTALVAAQRFKEKEVELARQQAAIDPAQLARVSAFLPDSVDNVQLIVDLNSLAARSGIQLSNFDIEGGAPAAGTPNAPAALAGSPTTVLGSGESVESLQLSVSATGTYAAFRAFLDGVEKSLRPLDVVELAVQDSTTGVYTYKITFRLYWLR
jgi:hypothetical protein